MIANLDIDVLRSFLAICEHGSFARAASEINKTQSAVSMQMKRLEEVISRPIFIREGRQNKLTHDGERLLDYARRLTRLNDEAVITFAEPDLTGTIRLGTPDDFADRFLPEILGRFSRSHPLVQVDVECLQSVDAVKRVKADELDLSLLTCNEIIVTEAEIIRTEPLIWVTSAHHCHLHTDPLPVALSNTGCPWREQANEALEKIAKPYRIAYASTNSSAITAAVIAGLAIGIVPELSLRPGLQQLDESDGFPPLGNFKIGLIRATKKSSSALDALYQHIVSSLGQSNSDILRMNSHQSRHQPSY